MKLKSSQSGFTLVELMVVIAVMGILIAIALPQYSRFQMAARDAKRKSDLTEYHLTLQRYISGKNQYPIGGDGVSNFTDVSADTPTGIFAAGNVLTKEGLLPGPLLDPLNRGLGGFYYRYLTDSLGSKYMLYAKLETGTTLWWTQSSGGVAEGMNLEPNTP